MKRDIVNHLGEKIGELELPDNTPAEVWEARLATYSTAPSALVPQVVTPRQIRLALIKSNIPLQTVLDAIALLPSPHKETAEVEWEYSTAVERQNPLVEMLATAQGIPIEQVDALFILAGAL